MQYTFSQLKCLLNILDCCIHGCFFWSGIQDSTSVFVCVWITKVASFMFPLVGRLVGCCQNNYSQQKESITNNKFAKLLDLGGGC